MRLGLVDKNNGSAGDLQGHKKAASVTLAGLPGVKIIPTINGVETGKIYFDALTTAQIVEARVSYWSDSLGDTVTSAQRLMDGKPDVEVLLDGETIKITSGTVLTNVTIAMVANIAVVEAAYNASTKTATGTIATSQVVEDFETVLVEFDFDPDGQVDAVYLTLNTYSDATTEKNLGTLSIAGYAQ